MPIRATRLSLYGPVRGWRDDGSPCWGTWAGGGRRLADRAPGSSELKEWFGNADISIAQS